MSRGRWTSRQSPTSSTLSFATPRSSVSRQESYTNFVDTSTTLATESNNSDAGGNEHPTHPGLNGGVSRISSAGAETNPRRGARRALW